MKYKKFSDRNDGKSEGKFLKKLFILFVPAIFVGSMFLTQIPLFPEQNSVMASESAPALSTVSFSSSLLQGNTVLLNSTFFESHSPIHITSSLETVFSHNIPFMVLIYGAYQYRGSFLSSWQTAMQAHNTKVPFGVVNKASNESALLNSPAIAITFDPFGIITAGLLTYSHLGNFVSYAEHVFQYEKHPSGITPSSSVMQPTGSLHIVSSSYDVVPSYFSLIGYTSWYTEVMDDAAGTAVGQTSAMWTLYEYTYVTSSGVVYYEFGEVSQQNIEGYSLSNGNWVPTDLNELTNWDTSQFSTQELNNHAPLNSGTIGSGTTTYTIGTTIGPASLSVSFTEPNDVISYSDQSNPSAGVAEVDYNFFNNPWEFWHAQDQTNTLYTTFASSDGFMQPSGSLPLYMYIGLHGQVMAGGHYFSSPTLDQEIVLYTGSFGA